MDRGWYAGPIGWMDATEDGEFCVGLRSALLRDREAHLYAGVGVVAGSDPAAELDETEVKLQRAAAAASAAGASGGGGVRGRAEPPQRTVASAWRRGCEAAVQVDVRGGRPGPRSGRCRRRARREASASESRRRWGRSKRSAALAASTPRGVPSSASNSSPRERLGLRQEVEDAAAVVVDDDDAHRGRDVAQGGQAADVVEEAEVAGDDRRRPAARRGGADPRGDQAVDPVGAAVAEEAGVASRRPAGRPPGRGSACSRPCRRGRRRDGRAPSASVQAGLGDRPLAAGQLGGDRLARGVVRLAARAAGVLAVARRSTRARPARRRARSGRRAGSPPRAGSARSSRRRGRRRSGRRRRPPSQARSGLLVGISPKRRTRSGEPSVAEVLVAQQQVVAGDHVRAVVGAAAQLRGRLGEDREAGGLGEVGERLAQLGVELAPGDDHAGRSPRRCAWRPPRAGSPRARGRSASPRSAAARRAPRARAGRWR